MADLIDRQKAIRNICNEDCHQPQPCKWKCIAIEELEALPSVQPRKGKWIGYNADDKDWQRDDGSPIFMNCSECHEAVINNGSAHWNFCPNCGADMREGDSDEVN